MNVSESNGEGHLMRDSLAGILDGVLGSKTCEWLKWLNLTYLVWLDRLQENMPGFDGAVEPVNPRLSMELEQLRLEVAAVYIHFLPSVQFDGFFELE